MNPTMYIIYIYQYLNHHMINGNDFHDNLRMVNIYIIVIGIRASIHHNRHIIKWLVILIDHQWLSILLMIGMINEYHH